MKVAVILHVLWFLSLLRARQRLSKRLEVDYRGKMPSKMKVPEGTCVPFCLFWQLQSEEGLCVCRAAWCQTGRKCTGWSKIKARENLAGRLACHLNLSCCAKVTDGNENYFH